MPHYAIAGSGYALQEFPSECPRCSRLISANPVAQMSRSVANDFEFLFKCPHCGRFMISVFSAEANGQPGHLLRTLPATPKSRDFPLLDLISNRFANLYNQSSAAEAFGLDEIAGTGYRKALEFLVKDYCICLDASAAENIRKKFLKSVIDDYLPDGKLKIAATLTTWLGNDEGHYERRWVDADLQDLKALLELTITFVSEEVQLEQYVRRMKPDEPPKLTYVRA